MVDTLARMNVVCRETHNDTSPKCFDVLINLCDSPIIGTVSELAKERLSWLIENIFFCFVFNFPLTRKQNFSLPWSL